MSTSKSFNGHKNWNHWNVSLWINNDEEFYSVARCTLKANKGAREKAARAMLSNMADIGVTHTPDGAPYSVSAIKAAMQGMEA